MSHYTNPAFCQKSEFYPRMAPQQNNHKLTSAFSTDFINKSMILVDQNSMQRYAIVPTDDDEDVVDSNHEIIEMYNGRAHRYAVIPTDDDESCIGEDFEYSTTRVNDNKDQPLPLNTRAIHHFKQSHITPTKSKPFILNATKPTNSNQQLQQKHKNTPNIPIQLLDDSNHEFIEMYNGRAHRYAVIATDDDENCIGEDFEFSTSGISDNMNQSLPINTRAIHPFKNYHGTHIKSKPFILNATKLTNSNQQLQQKPKITPNVPIQLLMHCDQSTSDTREVATTKNAIATQKLHELLSTPRKCKQEGLQRYGSYQTIIQKSPNQFQLKELYSSQQATKLSPQKLQYDDQKSNVQCIEPRTTAIISPRLHQQSIYNETTLSEDKTPSHESFQKVESATTTIGIISLMLILIGVLNSGLCLYMVTDMRRSYYLDLGIISGFAESALGVMAYRSRKCYWPPNRNYISGYVLVTIFSLLNCCGLLVLLGLNPFPGTPFHDLTTGVILALSSLILLIISLGVITSKLCFAPPPDNRVHVY